MSARKIIDKVYAMGAIHWDRTHFEDLAPLRHGTTYNCYYIEGSEKNVLIDTVDPDKLKDLLSNLKEKGITKLDYVISNHAEQDHSGSIPVIVKEFGAKIVTNKKCKELLLMHLEGISDKDFMVIEDGDTLSLGNKTIEFIFAPWVHWPETMFSYLKEDKILFSCDFLGQHVTSGELFVDDEVHVLQEAKIYYADIMMPFRKNIKKHLERLEPYEIRYVCPSHGQVLNKPALLIDAYKEWIDDKPKNLCIIPFASTHGSISIMAEYLLNALVERGVNAKLYRVSQNDINLLAADLVDAATVVLGSSTYVMGPHPEIATTAFLVNILRPKFQFMSIIGSYAWATRVTDVLTEMINTIKPEILEPVFAKGLPRKDDFKNLERLADDIAQRHRSLGLIK